MERGQLLPITVRFAPDAWEAIREIAEEKGLPQAEIVRMAVTGNLAQYLGNIRYIDPQQGTEIRRRVTELVDNVSGIRTSLDRIMETASSGAAKASLGTYFLPERRSICSFIATNSHPGRWHRYAVYSRDEGCVRGRRHRVPARARARPQRSP